MSDVVAELDKWLDRTDVARIMDKNIVCRARDEIVALRVERDRLGQFVDSVKHHIAAARAEALEEAAQTCERFFAGGAARDDCAAAIRALKDKPHGS